MIELIAFLFGALFGSFANVCIYRLPRIHPQLTEQSLRVLAADMPAEMLAKLAPLQNQAYLTGNDLIAALEAQLGKEAVDRYGDLIFQAAAFRKESIVFPGSHCPRCQTPIKPWDNVPIVSFLLLRGKCRACQAKISWRYPFVELLTALLFAAVVHQFGLTPATLAYLGFVLALLAISFIDFDHLIIPDEITLPGIVIGLIASFWLPLPATFTHWDGALLGALVGGGLIALVGYVGRWVFKKEAMGGGDVKLMAMIGAFLGWQMVFLTMFFASTVGAVIGIIMKFKSGNEYIPFGPFLSLGAIIALFFGQQFLGWYGNLIFP